VQIHCHAPTDLLERRYRERIGERHPGHADADRVADAGELFAADRYLLTVPGDLVSVDTSSFDRVDYGRILAAATRASRAPS
jgi:hypothetical protein